MTKRTAGADEIDRTRNPWYKHAEPNTLI